MRSFLTAAMIAALCACGEGGTVPSQSVSLEPPAGAHPAIAQTAARLRTNERSIPFAKVGSSNTVTADMPVPRPGTKPCTVFLFQRFAFKNDNNKTFSFTPPASCPGPWAKVVFNFDLRVSKGVQYDRTGIIWLDGGVVFFGTTAEPSPQLAPHWHVERDVTDLSALFKNASQGQIALGNCYCPPSYTGILYGRAWLQFYPADSEYPAPTVPDEVIGMPYSPPLGGYTQLPQSTMAIATPLPRTIVAADLDIYLQSQDKEEQWFMCVPNSVWTKSQNALGFCQDSAFREGVVTIDGTPAGIAPVYPWIYTGGMDPYLWEPIPAVQTLDFTPYRVNLTPFAGYLDGANTPTIAVTADNAYDYFIGAGDLLLYLDPKLSTVTGKLVRNTLTAPQTAVSQHIKYGHDAGGLTASGPVSVRSQSDFTIEGYVLTSSGKVETIVHQDMSFLNAQRFTDTASEYVQDMQQTMTLQSRVQTLAGTKRTVTEAEYEYPIDVAYPITATSTGFQLPIAVYQGYQVRLRVNGAAPFSSLLRNTVTSADTMLFNSAGQWTGIANGSSSQLYTYKDSTGICYGEKLASKNNVLASDQRPGCTAPSPPPPAK